ncbi:TPM domain-containing protein [Dongia sedimenti]|uniref:TPM domain-containing protein n=1 Tax=Dongia sedimenti TaxID=3064282 RepID=A0ABU0YIZ7_9PROT|nr:TPM domain-containing protein [Rhodospirillaceae bacterium R-7]
MRVRGIILGVVARLALLVTVLAGAPALGLSTPERNGWVTDQAGILDPDTAGAIATKLADLQRNTGDEVVVVTLSDLQGASIETWGNVLGESWNVGRSGGHETGVVLIVAPNDRKVRIAVGYGLGNRIPDSVAAAIIADHILPYFKQGDFARGVSAGVDSIAVQLNRGPSATTTTNRTDVERGAYPVGAPPPGFWTRLRHKLLPGVDADVFAFWAVVFIVVFFLMVLNVGNVGGRGRRRWNGYYYDDDDWSRSSSGSSSGRWFSGGGGGSSSGSGSSSGGSFGGGATGSW